MALLLLLISLVLISWSSSTSSSHNTNHSISHFECHPHESFALLGFLNSMTINYSVWNSLYFRTWKKGSDCCGWDGITCDSTSHHVVLLDLQDSGLIGTLDSNNSLFHLHHLRLLDLSFNDFRHSTISSMYGSGFPFLEFFSLADSNFSGEVPVEISKLSKLSPGSQLTMKMSTFHGIISNLTHLTDLHLSGVNIDSTIPPSLNNLSSLSFLYLVDCNLRGELPANVLNLPQLISIYLGGNKDLHANFPLSNWSTSLTDIQLSNVNFSSELPTIFPTPTPTYSLTKLRSKWMQFLCPNSELDVEHDHQE